MDDLTFVQRTRAVLAERGLWKGGGYADGCPGGPVCTMGAANVVLCDGDPYSLASLDPLGDERLKQIAWRLDLVPSEGGIACANDGPWDLGDALSWLDLLAAELTPRVAVAA